MGFDPIPEELMGHSPWIIRLLEHFHEFSTAKLASSLPLHNGRGFLLLNTNFHINCGANVLCANSASCHEEAEPEKPFVSEELGHEQQLSIMDSIWSGCRESCTPADTYEVRGSSRAAAAAKLMTVTSKAPRDYRSPTRRDLYSAAAFLRDVPACGSMTHI